MGGGLTGHRASELGSPSGASLGVAGTARIQERASFPSTTSHSRTSGESKLLSEPPSPPLEADEQPWEGSESPSEAELLTEEQGTKSQGRGTETQGSPAGVRDVAGTRRWGDAACLPCQQVFPSWVLK